ncbi:hypothetical protein ACTA71_012355 [Dictyostelium dimigraforme]
MYDKSKCSFISNAFSNPNNIKESTVYYNLHKRGVDLADSHFNRYLNKHRNKKWTISLLNALMSMCITNTWIIKRHFNRNLQQLDVIEELLFDHFPSLKEETKIKRGDGATGLKDTLNTPCKGKQNKIKHVNHIQQYQQITLTKHYQQIHQYHPTSNQTTTSITNNHL